MFPFFSSPPPLFMKKDVFSISSYNPTRQSRIEALRRQLFAKYFPIILWPTFGFYESGKKKNLLNSSTWLYHGPLLRINPHRLIENVNSTFFSSFISYKDDSNSATQYNNDFTGGWTKRLATCSWKCESDFGFDAKDCLWSSFPGLHFSVSI